MNTHNTLDYFRMQENLCTGIHKAMTWMHKYGDQERDMDGSFVFDYNQYLKDMQDDIYSDKKYYEKRTKIHNVRKHLTHYRPLSEVYCAGIVKAIDVLLDIQLKYINTPTGYKVQPIHQGELVYHATESISHAIAYLWGLKMSELHEESLDLPHGYNSLRNSVGRIPASVRVMHNMDLMFHSYMSKSFLTFCSAVSYYDDLQTVSQ
jgi:hypothetical protein